MIVEKLQVDYSQHPRHGHIEVLLFTKLFLMCSQF